MLDNNDDAEANGGDLTIVLWVGKATDVVLGPERTGVSMATVVLTVVILGFIVVVALVCGAKRVRMVVGFFV